MGLALACFCLVEAVMVAVHGDCSPPVVRVAWPGLSLPVQSIPQAPAHSPPPLESYSPPVTGRRCSQLQWLCPYPALMEGTPGASKPNVEAVGWVSGLTSLRERAPHPQCLSITGLAPTPVVMVTGSCGCTTSPACPS